MPLPVFTSSDTINAATMNKLVDVLPKSVVHSWTGPDSALLPLALTAAYQTAPHATFLISPIVGNYLRVTAEMFLNPVSGTGNVSVRIWRGGVEVEFVTITLTQGVWQTLSTVLSINAMGSLGDCSCEECEVRFYFKRDATAGSSVSMRNVIIASGMGNTLADYLE